MVLAAGISSAVPCVAWAQDVADSSSPPGFAIDRFNTSERGSDWFVLDSLNLQGHLRPALGLVIDYAHRPLVYYGANDEALSDVVSKQLYGHLGGSLTLWNTMRLGVNVPVALLNNGNAATVNGIAYTGPSGAALGDMRLSGTVGFYGKYGDPFTAALGFQLFLPTGNASRFTSDSAARGLPYLAVAGTSGNFMYAAQLGIQFRPTVAGFDDGTGTELQYAASAGMKLLDGRLVAGPELYGSSVVASTSPTPVELTSRASSSLEAMMGAHYSATPSVRIGLGAGAGLTKGYGTPAARVLGTLEWVTPYDAPKPPPPQAKPEPPKPQDRDKDGILDPDDACPIEPGVKSEDPKKHGCPLPGDKDKDGILDPDDACPLEPGIKSEDPKKHGCPPPKDTDGDTIFDEDDACPKVPGVKSQDPKKHGCPLPLDRDKDGFADHVDACPDEPGTAHPEDPSRNGCPVITVERNQIHVPPIEFDQGKHRIRPDAEVILHQLWVFLSDPKNGWIKRVSIEGHTNDDGLATANLILSKNRAKAVVDWLTARGIDRSRLVSQGFGQSRPVVPHGMPGAKERNRRVEYIIVDPVISTEKK